MKAPQLAPAEKIRQRLLGNDLAYPEQTLTEARQFYRAFVETLGTRYQHLFPADTNLGRTILTEIVLVKELIDFGDDTVKPFDQLFLRIENLKPQIVSYIQERTIQVINLLQTEIISCFPGANKEPVVEFLASPPQKLFCKLRVAKSMNNIQEAWDEFKRAVNSPNNDYLQKKFRSQFQAEQAYSLGDKINEIDSVLGNAQIHITGLANIVKVIDTIPEKIDGHDAMIHQESAQHQSRSSTKDVIETYCRRDLVEGQDIQAIYETNNNVTLVLGVTDAHTGNRTERKLKLIAPHNEDAIDNRINFYQIGFSRITILAVYADIKATQLQEQVINTTEQVTSPSISTTFITPSLGDRIRNGWKQFTNLFSINALRRSPLFAVGLALFLGLAHSGKANHQNTHTADQTPITTAAHTATDNTDDQLTQIDTPAPAPTIANTIPQTESTITHASTSTGSRYSADSHNHNTDETLQRMIKGMGFNSVQTKVIATRLDHQLQAARNLQAPGIHTQANQDVVMEELNGQVRLSVQDAGGTTLYRTNWFAREIGFRNFQPRK